MFKKLLRTLFPVTQVVVEVEAPHALGALSSEERETIQTLAHHPGFQVLRARLKMQRGLLETTLKNSRHKSLRDVEFLQSGIFWTKWLESQVSAQVFQANTQARRFELSPQDQEALAAVKTNFEVVGQ